MATLVDDLVGLSRIGRQDLLRREVGLTTLVEDVVDQLRSSSDGRVIEWQIEELPTVECDPALTKIAITHLLSNAVKFTRPRERATIRIQPVEADGQVGLRVAGQRRRIQDGVRRQAVRHVPATRTAPTSSRATVPVWPSSSASRTSTAAGCGPSRSRMRERRFT